MGIGVLGAGSATLGLMGYPLPAMIFAFTCWRLWREFQKKLLEIDMEIALAEIDFLDAEGLRQSEEQAFVKEARAKEQREMLAGIEFDTPVGRFEGAQIFGYASREGKRYEYAGLAGVMDEPSEDMLIVNGLLYARI